MDSYLRISLACVLKESEDSCIKFIKLKASSETNF